MRRTRYARAMQHATRRLHSAELLAIGTELTVGETVDTNSGDLARACVALGVHVTRVANLPDDLDVVVDAMRTALTRADLVITTGGLGPTPDDLTREAVAAVCGEDVVVHPDTLAWLEGIWARRGQPFPSVNVKQAWVIPSATVLPNHNGTAPGWWVDRPDGRVIVTLPGPPREMRPMWTDGVVPLLHARGVGADLDVRTLRLTGIGESQLAEILGDAILRRPNPVVATYARRDAVDVRISARADAARGAAELADAAEAELLGQLGVYVWARGATTWAEALDAALAPRGWTVGMVECGTGGALVGLLGTLSSLRRAEVLAERPGTGDAALMAEAERVRAAADASVGLAVAIRAAGSDTDVDVAIVTPDGSRVEHRLAFLRGRHGADRAALAGAAVLLEILRA